jgi:replicative DNA helicase
MARLGHATTAAIRYQRAAETRDEEIADRLDSFVVDLDQQLASDRGPDGQPSATDFLVIELPAAVERFATGFDDLPEIIDGFHSGRMLPPSGRGLDASPVGQASGGLFRS